MKKRLSVIWMLILVLMLEAVCTGPVMAASADAAKKGISAKKAVLYAGERKKLTVRSGSKKIRWSSSSKKVASVSADGVVTARKKGSAVITAKAGKKKYTCRVIVKKAGKLTFSLHDVKLGEVQDSGFVKVRFNGKKITPGRVKWSSTDPLVAIMDGEDPDLMCVKTLDAGSCTITGTYRGAKARIRVTVLAS